MSSRAPLAGQKISSNWTYFKWGMILLGVVVMVVAWTTGGYGFFAQAGLPVGLALILAPWFKSTEARKAIIQDVGASVLLFSLLLAVSRWNLLTGPFATADATKTGNVGSFLENLALLLSLFTWLGLCRSILFEAFKGWIEPLGGGRTGRVTAGSDVGQVAVVEDRGAMLDGPGSVLDAPDHVVTEKPSPRSLRRE